MPVPVKARTPVPVAPTTLSPAPDVARARVPSGGTAMARGSAEVVAARTQLGNAALTSALGTLPRGEGPAPSGWAGQLLLAGQNLVGNQVIANQAATAPPATAPRQPAKKQKPAPPKTPPKVKAPPAQAPDQKALGPEEKAKQGKDKQGKEEAGPRSPGTDPKFQALKQDVRAKKRLIGSSHPPATAEAGAAQAASVPPADDQEARGKAAHAEDMDAAQPKEFDKAAFVKAVEDAIAKRAPQNLDDADKFGDSGKAEEVKAEVQGEVEAGKEGSAQEIADTTAAVPEPAPDAKQVVPLAPDKMPGKPGAPNPAQAVPDPLPPSATDMSAGPARVEGDMAAANVTEQQLSFKNAREPAFDKAVRDKKAMDAHSETAPGELRDGEAREIKHVKSKAATKGAAAMGDLHATRARTGDEVSVGKVGRKGEDQDKRTQVTALLQKLFDRTKCDVEKILSDLDKTVDEQFTTEEKRARDTFTEEHTEGMREYKRKRYKGLTGKARWVKDLFADLPEEANEIYVRAKNNYLTAMRGVITNIADTVERELRKAKDRIATGRTELKEAVDKLPKDLRAIGREAATEFEGQFDELKDTVNDKGTALVDTLATKYTDAVKAVDAEIAAEKEKNKGLVSKAADAISGVINTIKELGRLLMGVLRKAASAIGLILRDPIGFLGNLITGVGGGLKLFMKNAGRHLQQGVLAWLLGTGVGAGLQLPTTFDVLGILVMIAGLLGLSWPNLRARLARKVDPRAMAAAETGADAIPIVVEARKRGVAGLWSDLKERVGDLKKDLIGKLVSYLLPTIIIAGVTWIVSLFNPASAFIRACKMIIDIVRFIVTQGRQIIEFVNTVLDAVIAIARGGTGGVPALVERAMAKSIPVLIGALAAILGIGGIAGKVKQIFQQLARPVNRAIDWVIDKITGLLKKLWAKLKAKLDRRKKPKKPRADKDRDPRGRRPSRRRRDRRSSTRRRPDRRSDKAKARALAAALRDARRLLRAEDATPKTVQAGLQNIKRQHRLTSIQLKKKGDDDYSIRVTINPAGETEQVELTLDDFPYEIVKAEGGFTIKRREGSFVQLDPSIIPMEGLDHRTGFVVTIATIPSEVKNKPDMAVRYLTQAWTGGTEDMAAARTAVVIGINSLEHLNPTTGRGEIGAAIAAIHRTPELLMAVFGFVWTPKWHNTKTDKPARFSDVRRKYNRLPVAKKPLAEKKEGGLRGKEALPYGLFRQEVLASSYVQRASRALAKVNEVVHLVGQDADTGVSAKNMMGVLAAYAKILQDIEQHPLMMIGGYRFGGFRWRRGEARRRKQLTMWSNEVDRAIRVAVGQLHPQMLYPTEPNMLIKALDRRHENGIFDNARSRGLLEVQGELYGVGHAEGRFLRNRLMEVFGTTFTIEFAPEASTVTSAVPGDVQRGLEVTPAGVGAAARRRMLTVENGQIVERRIRRAHRAYALIVQSQTMASAMNLARELTLANPALRGLDRDARNAFQRDLRRAIFNRVEDVVLLMTDKPRLTARSSEIQEVLTQLHEDAATIAGDAVEQGSPQAMRDTIKLAEDIAERIIDAMTANELKSMWDRLHRLLNRIMNEQNQGGGGRS
ncbi:MAG: hypothetical protein WBA97_22585 [Actinophytocola sp.]|uniref:phage tail protein n=1 Tax=Actinophytocola sp. TaxID=1872138 RepID=UPI003C7872BA